MTAESRQQQILELLAARGRVTNADLAVRFTVSEMTLRRDLAQLEQAGLLRRVHGGATPTESGSFEPPFAIRARLHHDAKRAIAAGVAREVRDGQTIVLDGGTTGTAVAEALVGRDVTVCALNLRVAEILASSPATRVMVPGGSVRHGELSFSGPAAERTLADHRFDLFVMTVSAVDATAGFTEWNVGDAAVKRAAVSVSGRCIVACDSSKFGHIAFARIGGLEVADLIVTDADLDVDLRAQLTVIGATVQVA